MSLCFSPEAVDRFWSKVDCGTDDECWGWMGSKSGSGYGTFSINHKNYAAHRISYQLECKMIPKGHELHHKCNNRLCVNPFHLILATKIEHFNLSPNSIVHKIANKNRIKTHCLKGHEFTLENTRYSKQGHRNCRMCKRGYDASYHALLRGKKE